MPQIDITDPLIAGLNAGSDAASGVVQGFLGGAGLQQRQYALHQRDQAMRDDAEYRSQMLGARAKELEALARERDRQAGFEERRVALAEGEVERRKQDDTDAASGLQYVANLTRSTLGRGTVDQFEEELRAQRAAAMEFAGTLSSRGRALVLAGLDDDERAERASLVQKAAEREWENAATNPILAQDQSPMAEEIRNLAMEHLDALKSGAVTPAQSMRDLKALREQVVEHSALQKDFATGWQWGQQQVAEGGADISGMNRALAEYEALGPGKGHVDDFKVAMLKAKHGVGLDDIKLGKVSVPRSINVRSPEWAEIAEVAADEEVAELMGRDPLLKARIERGEFDTPEGEKKYDRIRQNARNRVLRSYAARSGMSRAEMGARGWIDRSEADRVEADARAEIEKALRAAGIDPNMKVRAPRSAPVTPEQRRREPEVAPDRPMQLRLPDELGGGMTGTEKVDTFDEADLEEIYRDDG